MIRTNEYDSWSSGLKLPGARIFSNNMPLNEVSISEQSM